MSSFHEKFKGKISIMPKEGFSKVIDSNLKPIIKHQKA